MISQHPPRLLEVPPDLPWRLVLVWDVPGLEWGHLTSFAFIFCGVFLLFGRFQTEEVFPKPKIGFQMCNYFQGARRELLQKPCCTRHILPPLVWVSKWKHQ